MQCVLSFLPRVPKPSPSVPESPTEVFIYKGVPFYCWNQASDCSNYHHGKPSQMSLGTNTTLDSPCPRTPMFHRSHACSFTTTNILSECQVTKLPMIRAGGDCPADCECSEMKDSVSTYAFMPPFSGHSLMGVNSKQELQSVWLCRGWLGSS